MRSLFSCGCATVEPVAAPKRHGRSGRRAAETEAPPVTRGQGRVLAALARRGLSSARELAEELEITPIAVRQHLRGLARRDLVAVAHLEGGRPGHPERVWVATPAGCAWVAPEHPPRLLTALLETLRARSGDDETASLLEEAARRYVREAHVSRLRPLSRQLEGLREALLGLGIGLRWAKRGEPPEVGAEAEAEVGYTLTLTSLGFLGFEAHPPPPYLERFHRALVEEALGLHAQPERVETEGPLQMWRFRLHPRSR